MSTPLDDIEFLSRSGNRVTLLESLSARSQTRAELEDLTGISKVTIGRAVEALEVRGWIIQRGDTYETTPTGEAVAADLATLQTTVGTAQRLQPVAPYLDVFNFDIKCLEDARVTVPDSADPMAPFGRVFDLLDGAEHARFISRMAAPAVLQLLHEAVLESDLVIESIMTSGVVNRIRGDQQMQQMVRDIVADESVDAFLHDGPLELEVAEIDGTVAILVTDGENVPQAFIETRENEVLTWFNETFKELLGAAERLSPDDFS